MDFDVITIGTATRDAFVRSKEFKRKSSSMFLSGESLCLPLGEKIDVEDIIFATGGGATNAAVTFSRQGLNTSCVCKIGNDVSGREVLQNLKQEGVATNFIIEDSNNKTAYSILLLSPNGERTVLVYRGASEHFKPADFNLRTLNAKWFYIAGSIPTSVLNLILNKAKETNTKVAYNPSKSEIKTGLGGLGDVLKKLDVLLINREEGSYLTGIDYKKEDKIFKKLDDYVNGIVVLTDGNKGALISDGKSIFESGIFRNQNVVDRTGAGDAFGSGFVAGLIERNDIQYAIRLASANATGVVEKMGAKDGILTKDKFLNEKRWQDFKIKIR
ncbi:MAG: carbohydrate kinase family protein [bacterium]|nr:carbohydrate kinase family protein [bacterium]